MTSGIFKKIYYSLKRIYAELETKVLSGFRDKTSLFFMAIYPALIIAIFGFVFGGMGDQEFHLYYLNEDLSSTNEPTAYATDLLTTIEGSVSNIKLEEVVFNRTDQSSNDWMIEHETRVLLVIPKGWSTNLSSPSPTIQASVEYYYDPGYSSAMVVYEIISSAVQEINNEIVGTTIIMDLEITSTPGREDLTMVDFYVPGIIGITISTSGMIGLVNDTITERTTGLLFKKSSSPLKKWEWAAATELWQITMGLVVSLITILTALLLFKFPLSMLHPAMLLFVIFGSMTFAGIGLIITRFVKQRDAAQTAAMAFTFPQMFLAGAIFPPEILPDAMITLSKIFPLYYMIEGMRDLMLDSTVSKAWLNLGICGAMGIAFFIIGVLVSNWRKE
ncbi:MAG: ABC transporter permease [Promethearchaeota archaeon]|nr:MAG: ABC transporter permease [Candidatus Lokiarchaeota archaeon]